MDIYVYNYVFIYSGREKNYNYIIIIINRALFFSFYLSVIEKGNEVSLGGLGTTRETV